MESVLFLCLMAVTCLQRKKLKNKDASEKLFSNLHVVTINYTNSKISQNFKPIGFFSAAHVTSFYCVEKFLREIRELRIVF